MMTVFIAFLFTLLKTRISSGHITHIEKYLIQRLRSLKTAQIKNGNDGVAVNLSRPEKSQVENIIEKLELVLPILGFTFLTDSTSNRNSQAVRKAEFELVAHDGRVKASAYEYEGQIVVKRVHLFAILVKPLLV